MEKCILVKKGHEIKKALRISGKLFNGFLQTFGYLSITATQHDKLLRSGRDSNPRPPA